MTTTTASIENIKRNIGIDVSKDTLDVYVYQTDQHWQAKNSTAGIRSLLSRLRRFNIDRIVVEASGGYERRLVEACRGSDLPLVVAQAYTVKSYARTQRTPPRPTSSMPGPSPSTGWLTATGNS
ncbi:MAG: transposase [Halioglobus sp.]|nr:transposase [Halioglobus sp.]